MFDAVIHPDGTVQRRLGTGTAISVVLHVGALAAALWLTAVKPVPRVTTPPLVFPTFMPRLTHPSTTAAAPPAARPHAVARRHHPIIGKRILPRNEPAASPQLDVPGQPDVDAQVADSPVAQAAGPVGGAPLGASGPTGGPLVFDPGQGMTPPKLLSGRDPVYTSQARAAGVEGTIVAKCVITEEGAMRDCRILRGLPLLNPSVLEALATRRYRPVTFDGRPVAVQYIITVKMELR